MAGRKRARKVGSIGAEGDARLCGADRGKLAATGVYSSHAPGSLLDRIPCWGWHLRPPSPRRELPARLGGTRLGTIHDPRIAGIRRERSLAVYQVRLETDSLVPVVPNDVPAVVMVSSVTLRRLRGDDARWERRPPAPALLVTLEGAALGHAMARHNGLRSTWHAGPADGSGATLLTFQYPGTPTFLLVEPDGRVRRALIGYPGREAFRPWLRVMAGETTTL